jgi:hypothetical protein
MKIQIIRAAVADYHNRIGRLGESERQKLLKAFDTLVPFIPPRPQVETDRELKEIRQARRTGGRRAHTGSRIGPLRVVARTAPARRDGRARGSVSCALGCSLWTLNYADFRDIPGLRLVRR